jgi:hypothetical protein
MKERERLAVGEKRDGKKGAWKRILLLSLITFLSSLFAGCPTDPEDFVPTGKGDANVSLALPDYNASKPAIALESSPEQEGTLTLRKGGTPGTVTITAAGTFSSCEWYVDGNLTPADDPENPERITLAAAAYTAGAHFLTALIIVGAVAEESEVPAVGEEGEEAYVPGTPAVPAIPGTPWSEDLAFVVEVAE